MVSVRCGGGADSWSSGALKGENTSRLGKVTWRLVDLGTKGRELQVRERHTEAWKPDCGYMKSTVIRPF